MLSAENFTENAIKSINILGRTLLENIQEQITDLGTMPFSAYIQAIYVYINGCTKMMQDGVVPTEPSLNK